MENIHHRQRSAYERRVRQALTAILNDPDVMPNSDCRELVVSIGRLVFGKTVRDIYIEISGQWRDRDMARTAHMRYLAEAKGERSYVDLTDAMHLPGCLDAAEAELQRRLELQYQPRIRPLGELSR